MHSGASVNAVTKSGTNLFHGDLFEFVRNHRFNATNPFNAIDPGDRRAAGRRPEPQPVRRHVRRPDRDRPPVLLRRATRARDCARRRRTCSPSCRRRRCWRATSRSTRRPQCNTPAPCNLRAPFVNNRLDPALVQPGGAEASPRVCRRRPTRAAACTYSRSRPQDEAQYIGKVDVQLSQNHSLFGRYMLTTQSSGRRRWSCSRRTSWCRAWAAATTWRTRSRSATRWC